MSSSSLHRLGGDILLIYISINLLTYSQPMQSNRIEALDSLRVLATFAVILVHVSHPLTEQIYHQYWWVANLYDSSARFCVPIFLMLSGSLLLKKQESFKSFISKRFVRILLPFLFWNTTYLIINQYFLYRSERQFYSFNMAIKAYLKGASFHFWYVYMILGLYLFIPILTSWITLRNRKQITYFLSIWTITVTASCISPKYQSYLIELPYFSGYIGYLLLGYWLSIQDIPKKYALSIGLTLFLFGVIFTYYATEFVSLKLNHFDHQYYNYCTLNVTMTSIGVFLIVNNMPTLEIKIWRSICGLLAKFSYGIYLVHILVLDRIIARTSINYTYINPIIGIILTTSVCFIISFFIVILVNRLPFGKNFSG